MGLKLIDKLPSFYGNGGLVPEIQKSLEIEREILEKEIIEFRKQLFVETSSWALNLWEEFLNIPIDESLGIDLRRSRIKAKITRSTPALTQNQLKNILSPYFESIEIFEYARENRFEAIFGTNTIIGGNLNIAINEIEESKPAHLAYLVGINYITQLVISKLFKRWDSDVIPVCGTIDISYNQYVACNGKSVISGIYGNNSSMLSEELNKVSEETIILGDGTRLTSNLELLVNKFSSDEFIKVAEELYLNNTNGKSLKDIITNEINNIYSEEFTKVSDENFVGEVK